MELKSNVLAELRKDAEGSNRTFMELKLKQTLKNKNNNILF